MLRVNQSLFLIFSLLLLEICDAYMLYVCMFLQRTIVGIYMLLFVLSLPADQQFVVADTATSGCEPRLSSERRRGASVSRLWGRPWKSRTPATLHGWCEQTSFCAGREIEAGTGSKHNIVSAHPSAALCLLLSLHLLNQSLINCSLTLQLSKTSAEQILPWYGIATV